MQTTPHAARSQLLAIRVGDVRCCIDLDTVEQVVSLMALDALPGAPPCIKGFFNYSGAHVAAIDLAERLTLAPQPAYTLDTSVIVIRMGGDGRRAPTFQDAQFSGLIVDDVYGLIRFQASDASHQNDFKNRQLPFKGTVPTPYGTALWLDLDGVLNLGGALDRPLFDYAPADNLRVAGGAHEDAAL